MAARFYVYRFDDAGGCVYVGKGSGRRFNVQQRKFACDGRIVEWFKTESKAYEAERRLIAQLMPRLNVHAGGNGSRATRRVNRRPSWQIAIERMGTRKYAARILLACERSVPGILKASDLDQIRMVAA